MTRGGIFLNFLKFIVFMVYILPLSLVETSDGSKQFPHSCTDYNLSSSYPPLLPSLHSQMYHCSFSYRVHRKISICQGWGGQPWPLVMVLSESLSGLPKS